MRQTKYILFLAVFLALAGRSLAQSVRWDPPGGQLGFNQVSQLTLTFDGCEPDLDQLKVPRTDGLTFGQPSQNSSMSIVNFKTTRTFSLIFPVRPDKRAPITIPAFDVATDKGAMHVNAASFTVGDATVGSSGLALDDISSAKFTLPKDTLWAGEVVPVTYSLSVVKRYFHSLASAVDWQPAPFVIEEWSKPEPSEITLRGERRIVATQQTRGYFKTAGSYTLKPASQLANLVVGSSGFGFFTTPTVEQRMLNTEPLSVSVRPLPNAPAGFSGAIGQFALVSKVVPTSPAVGEPVTWTLELTGTGNWPDVSGLPQREVSNDFSVVQPKSKRTMKDSSLFEGSLAEDVVLVPTKPGRYTLNPLKFTYFDTASGTYKTITTEAVTLNVGPGAAAPVVPATPNGPVQFSLPQSSQPTAPALPAAVPPVTPDNLPRDPLVETEAGRAPLANRPLVQLCLVAASACPLLLWLVLAAIRSRQLDPQRRRREARAALARVLAEAGNAGTSPTAISASLRLWQENTAALWEVPHAAPGASLLDACVASHRGDADVWTALWNEADRTLHGKEAALPADWMARADTALRAVKVSGWPVFSLLAPRHLLPFLFTLALLLVPAGLRADSPAEAYKRAEYPAAEQGWRTLVQQHPEDLTARHNLGLALAQQDRWAEAAAQWTSGFLLNSRHDTARWDLSLGLQRSGMAPPELVELSRGEGRSALARTASPAEWQMVLLGASLLFAAALVVLLLKGYGRIGAWARPVSLVTILIAMLLAAAATFSLRTYGTLADPDVVLVLRASTLRSIPTEADTAQKTSALSAGSIAVADRTFLGWSHLSFTGGQSGWVRSEELVRLYQ